MEYQPIVGLEVHVEINTQSKMFCNCPNDPNERHPNVNICPVCMGHPGVLPVINQEAVRKVLKTGLAFDCQIPEYSKFDRKNYFYPDLPKGYQISQLYQPLCGEGFLEIDGSPEGKQSSYGVKKIRIREVHLEEDTGKLIHPEGRDYSLVDFNRAGVPLMELVTEPDINSAREARRFAEELRLILRYLGVSDADMEKGQLRCEVNISLSKTDSKSQIQNKLGTKVEIKNLNSFRAVEKGIEYEIKRQTEVLEGGEKIIQETRGWDDVKQITLSQREKEESQDYRYFPEPDLPPLHFIMDEIEEIKREIPELPQQKRERFKKEYNLSAQEIELFVQNKELGEYFEKAMSELRNWVNSVRLAGPLSNGVKEAKIEKGLKEEEFLKLTKLCSNYITCDLQGLLKGIVIGSQDFLITPEDFGEFITLIYKGEISSKIAKLVLEEMVKTGADPSHIIEEKGWIQMTDESEIEKIIKEIISKNPKPVEDFKKGKENALQFLIGQAMAATKGKANPEMVNKILRKVTTHPIEVERDF